jgi:hypothetical protein
MNMVMFWIYGGLPDFVYPSLKSPVPSGLAGLIHTKSETFDILLQKERDTKAAKRFFRRLIENNQIPERIVTDGLQSYEAALKELHELACQSLC